jgi:hypothetical protein
MSAVRCPADWIRTFWGRTAGERCINQSINVLRHGAVKWASEPTLGAADSRLTNVGADTLLAD